MKVQKKFSRHC